MSQGNAIKWGAVTVSGCITSGTLGHYLPSDTVGPIVFCCALAFGVICSILTYDIKGI